MITDQDVICDREDECLPKEFIKCDQVIIVDETSSKGRQLFQEECNFQDSTGKLSNIDVLDIFETSIVRELLQTNDLHVSGSTIFKVHKRPKKNDGIYINGEINGNKAIITVDTGAARTVLSEDLFLKLPSDDRPQLLESSSLIGADGNPLEELGTAVFCVKLGNEEFEKELVVARIADDVLLGLDILMMGKFGPAEIKLGEKILFWNGESIPFNFIGNFNRVRNVVAADDTVVPGCSELILDVYVEKTDFDSWFSQQDFLIEPWSDFISQTPLLMATCLVDLTNNVTGKVRLMNPCKTDILVHQNTVVGTAQLTDDEIFPMINSEFDNEEPGNYRVRRLELYNTDVPSVEPNVKEDVPCTVPKKRPDPKPNIDQVKNPQRKNFIFNKNLESDKFSRVPPHLLDILKKIQSERCKSEIEEIAALFTDYGDVFSKDDDDLGVTNIAEHCIDTGTARPVKQPPRRVPLAFANKEKETIHQMERQGIIRKSTSPWASPLCLVMKKNGKIRPCIDYRRLNKVTENDAFPLPRIQDCLDAVSGSAIFTTVDMTSGYHQVPVKETDIPKTAFVTKYGLYEFTRMPMGLKSSAQTFQRVMELALQGLQWSICLIYLDDVIIFSRTFDEHIQRLKLVLQRVRQAGLKIKPEKCQFFQTEVTFLGHVVTGNGVRPNPENLAKIKQWPQPKSVTQIRQFLGLASYYRRFVKDFSKIVAPMVKLTKKGENFVWSSECEQSFLEIKSLLMKSPIMAYPNDEGEYILDTDASDVGIGAVLSQVQDNQEKVIAYGSRTLNKAERNYCVTDKELLALRYFVEYYRQYLLGRKFTVRTDHQALSWLFSLKEPKGRIARWIEILSAYDIKIQHRPGKKHSNADSLSRHPIQEECDCSETDTLENMKCGPCKKCVKRARDIQSSFLTTEGISLEPIRVVTRSNAANKENEHWTSLKESYNSTLLSKFQDEDQDIAPIITSLRKEQKPKPSDLTLSSPAARHYFNLWDSLTIVNGFLYKKFHLKNGSAEYSQLLTPTRLKQEILELGHCSVLSGHFGRKKTLEKIRRHFYWFEMREDVEVYIAKCDNCARNKYPNKKPKAPLGSMSVGAPLDRISIDVVGPLPRSPRMNRYFLTLTDNFTKWTEVYPIPDQTAETCTQIILNEFVSRFGCPESLHSDQGSNFESEVFRQLCSLLEIKKTRTSVRNPKGNGQCERVHRTILQMIRAYLKDDQTEWDQHLGCIMSAYRASVSESTGFTPNMMMLGREVKTPANLIFGTSQHEVFPTFGDYVSKLRNRLQYSHEICRKFMVQTARRRKDHYDVRLSLNNFKPGDAVWLLNEQRREGICQKLQTLYLGPCIVLQKFNSLNYCIQTSEDGPVKIVNHDKLKSYKGEDVPKWGKNAVRKYNRQKPTD